MNSEVRQKLARIYDLLLDHFGPRNWWPAQSDLEMITGAILTQNVSWKNTVTALDQLKASGVLSIEGLGKVPLEELARLIKSTRYHNTKAKKLKAFITFLKDKHNSSLDDLLSLPLQELRNELLSIYGIGEETADAITLYAGLKPIFVVDTYTRRIYQRLGMFPEKITYREMQEFFMEHLSHDVQLYNEYHALIDGLGNRYCSSKNPRCSECPLHEICKFPGDL